MCGLRTGPRTDVDPQRFLDRTAIGGGGISSRRPRGDTSFDFDSVDLFSDRSGININNLVEAAETIQNALYPERREKTIRYMIRHLDHYLDYQRDYRGGGTHPHTHTHTHAHDRLLYLYHYRHGRIKTKFGLMLQQWRRVDYGRGRTNVSTGSLHSL